MTPDQTGRDGSRRWTRRDFLQRAAVTTAMGMALPAWLPVARAGQRRSGEGKTLVYILLRGGIDGLSTVVPHGDGDYYAARPTLAVPPPGQLGGALDLDGFFGLNPAAAPLLPAYLEGRLAFVHAAGSPDPSRSHFVAARKIESGTPNQPVSVIDKGWMARHLLATPPAGSSPVRCVSFRNVLPSGLSGAPATVAAADLSTFAFPGDPATAAQRQVTLTAMYGPLPPPVGPAALTAMEATALLEGIDFAGYQPAGGASYPDGQPGAALRQAAALLKTEPGVEVVMLEIDGFDHHETQGPLDGTLAIMLDRVTAALAAFDADMGPAMDHIIVAAHSEFGRRVAENASLGTDHGHGGIILLLGGPVAGGQVHGAWPGLAPAALDQGDLAVTTDYRDVMGEILTYLGNTDLSVAFPGHVPSVPGVLL